MKIHRQSWFAMFMKSAILCLINMHCWKPGIGGRNDKIAGTELEIYLGWPACYRAELWRSDELLMTDLLKRAPFFRVPKSMWKVARYMNLTAIITDILFAISSIALVGIILNAQKNLHWPAKSMAVVIFLAAVLIICYRAGDSNSAHL
jgi:hypothetical protein